MVNFTPGIGIVKKTMLLLKIYLVVVLISISLCYYLTPIFGMAGAATSTLLSSVISFAINYFYSQRYYFIPYKILNLYILMIMVGLAMLFKFNMSTLTSIEFIPIFFRSLIILSMTITIVLIIIPKYDRKLIFGQLKNKLNVF